jgi:iron complex outermembrane receptor protein
MNRITRHLKNGLTCRATILGIAPTSLLAISIASLCPAAAMAQDKAAPATQAGKAADAADDTVADIIVTARQRSETLQQTPVSVTAINPARLEAMSATTIGDVSGAVPNVFIQRQPSGPSAAAISIRGIAFADIEKSFDPAVGVTVDGVYIGTNTGQLLDFFDIASFEVLRGPQGTLFGRNTTGGVMNIRRTAPTGELGGKFDFTYGNYGTIRGQGVLNVPVIKDVLALKLFEDHAHTDGYLYNATTNRNGPASTTDNFGAALLFTPTDSFQALFTIEKQTFTGETANSSGNRSNDLVCRAAPANQCNRNLTTDLYTIFGEFPTPSTYSSPAETLEMTYNLGGSFKLKSITGWRSSKELFRQDFDATSVPFYETIRDQTFRQFSQELRVSGDITDRLDIVAGLYYFDSRYTIHATTLLGPLLGNRQTEQYAGQTSKSYAGYVDVNWQFADKFRLSLGGRLTRDEKDFNNSIPGSFAVTASNHWSKFTPKASLDYRPNEDLMLYASYAQGYRSGGFNGRASTVSTSTTPYQPETVDSYEAGVKSQWFDHKLTLDVAGFYSKYSNKQESIIRLTPPGSANPQETVVANAASATIYGIEAELTARPTRALTINASAGYLKSKYDSFNTLNATTLAPIDLSGLSLIFNPQFTASIGGTYTVPTSVGKLSFNANYRHISTYFTGITPDPSNPNPAAPTLNYLTTRTQPFDQIDSSLTLQTDIGPLKPRINLFVRNLLDKRSASTTTVVPNLFESVTTREPRSYGLQVGFTF